MIHIYGNLYGTAHGRVGYLTYRHTTSIFYHREDSPLRSLFSNRYYRHPATVCLSSTEVLV